MFVKSGFKAVFKAVFCAFISLFTVHCRGECELQVKGFPGARFKKFGTEAEAWDFVEAINDCSSAPKPCSSAPKPWSSFLAKGVSSTASSSKRSYSAAPLKRLYSTDSVDPSPKKKRRTASATSAPSTSGYSSGKQLIFFFTGQEKSSNIIWSSDGTQYRPSYRMRLLLNIHQIVSMSLNFSFL